MYSTQLLSLFRHRVLLSWVPPLHRGAEMRFELGTALWLSDTLPAELRRNFCELRRTFCELRHTLTELRRTQTELLRTLNWARPYLTEPHLTLKNILTKETIDYNRQYKNLGCFKT